MKIRLLMTTLSAAFISMVTHAQVQVSVDGATMNSGWMHVYELPENGGDWQWDSGWSVPDLSASFNEANDIVTMVPNSIDDVNEYWYQNTTGTAPDPANPGGPGQRGNKSMQALFFAEVHDGSLSGQTVMFEGDVTSLTLSNSHSVIAFIKDFSSDYSTFNSATIPIATTGTFSFVLNTTGGADRHVQWGFEMTGENVWVTDLAPFGSLVVERIVPEDNQPPTPDPMGFAVLPFTLNDNSISMTASNATDNLFDVEYLFTNTVNETSSGWQSDTNFVDSGLNPGTLYTYMVMARDTHPSNNTTAASAPASATTSGADLQPPSPAMMTIEDADASSVSIMLTASTATDPSGVEYYFACTSGGPGGNDSGWQSNPIYINVGLSNNTTYTYTVQARDLSAAKNSNTVSSAVDVTTSSKPGTISFSNSLQGFTGGNAEAETRHELAKAGLVIVSTSTNQPVVFDSTGATFGVDATWENRNTLRTIGEDYGDYDFEISATFMTSNTAEQVAMIGAGQGIIGSWGIPDFGLVGVNAFVSEVQGGWSKLFTFVDGAEHAVTNMPGISSTLNRIKMVHDTTAKTVTVLVDTDYTGTFAADLQLGPQSTTNVWQDMPQRLYIAAGAGVLYKDLEIIVDTPAVTFDIDWVEPVPGGGAVLAWQGVFGQTYEVQYATDLVIGDWIADPTLADIYDTGDAMMSATSTVSEVNAFYRFILK